MAGPSQLSKHLADPVAETVTGPLAGFLARPTTRILLQLAAIGEMVADKVPGIPARIEPGPLVGRAFIGSVTGGVCAQIYGEPAGLGALAGGIAAVAGAVAGYHLRRALVRDHGLPDLPVALCEDAIALGLARRALRA